MNATRQNPPGRGEPAQTLTDTHAHLGDAVFDADRAGVLSAAGRAGIGRIIAVAETLADAEKNLVLADRHRAILPAAGLFPTYLDTSEAGRMRAFIRRHAGRLAAVGEVGLDYWKVQDEALREIQREIFCGFIDLAVELDIPLNVHSRSAGRHVIALLLERAAGRVQLHAFDGRASSALPAVEAGFLFSIPPSVVRSPQKQRLVRRLPLTHILVESDSPALGPEPGVRNEPANAAMVVRAIAELKGLRAEEVAENVVANTRRLYGDRAVLP